MIIALRINIRLENRENIEHPSKGEKKFFCYNLKITKVRISYTVNNSYKLVINI